MSYKIFLASGERYIVVQVKGAMTRALAAKIGKEMDEQARSVGVLNFMYDMRKAPNVAGVLDNYEFAHDDMARLELDRRARVAILVAEDDTSHDFVETAIRNAGYNTRLFRDEAEAIAWLELRTAG